MRSMQLPHRLQKETNPSIRILAIASMIISSSQSFTVLSHYRQRLSLLARSLSSDMDELMNDVLNGNNLMNMNEQAQIDSDSGKGWMTIDWEKASTAMNQQFTKPSPVEALMIDDRLVHLKRDDQLRLPGSQISGNKARKMLALSNLASTDFPQCIVSYGGPQSNAMVALAAVVRYRNDEDRGIGLDPKRFVYYTKKLPRFLKNQPSGNLFRAMSLGMELVELSPSDYNQLFGGEWGGRQSAPQALNPPVPGKSLWIPQGGASIMALDGARQLATEIRDFWSRRGEGQPLLVFVPGGTCSTGVLLHRAIKQQSKEHGDTECDIEVVVVPCVGDEEYARRQMMMLNAAITAESADDIPIILPPTPIPSICNDEPALSTSDSQYFQFGEPHASILETFRRMEEEHEVPVDLLYNAPALTIMFRHWRTTFASDARYANKAIMYVHSGGLEGVNSQLLRYRHKGLVELDDIQLPGRKQ
ncbi:hypothetical protein MPSEU_000126300 [Mayamaea pseudoterrestris]|nr:hypothetical protein MPSEU_000125000 [Mayamaea pseudoterrestris]GKY91542.1 hypothetical protein MPSEU_000126300 [Mayamaea pseudoterrestris]